MRRDAVRVATVCRHDGHVLEVQRAVADAVSMERGAGHHVSLASGQAAVEWEEMSWAITVSALMMPTATACTLGRRGRPSLAGVVPLRPAPARVGVAACSAQAMQAVGELWLHTSTGSIAGRDSSPSGLSSIIPGALDSVPVYLTALAIQWAASSHAIDDRPMRALVRKTA
eukprot:327809-Heterocapsa_arctica.AAC.1